MGDSAIDVAGGVEVMVPEGRRPGTRDALAAEELRALLYPGDDPAKPRLHDHLLEVVHFCAVAEG